MIECLKHTWNPDGTKLVPTTHIQGMQRTRSPPNNLPHSRKGSSPNKNRKKNCAITVVFCAEASAGMSSAAKGIFFYLAIMLLLCESVPSFKPDLECSEQDSTRTIPPPTRSGPVQIDKNFKVIQVCCNCVHKKTARRKSGSPEGPRYIIPTCDTVNNTFYIDQRENYKV
jgi:hypothetical protein